MMTGTDYYIPAAALAIALAVKLRWLWQTRNSPMSRSIFAILTTACAGFTFGAPPTVQRVNQLTGVPNISALIVYCILAAFSCASLVLLIHWKGGPAQVVKRHIKTWVGATVAAIVVFIVLFAFSEVPVERPRDLDTFYATTPYIREMIVLYLASHTATTLVVLVKCASWARELTAGWTRCGLLVLGAGYALSLGFSLLKLAAVASRWAGSSSWDALSTDFAPPLAGAGAITTTVGFVIPVAAPRVLSAWQAWRSYRQLEPLWRALAPWDGAGASMRLPKWSMIEMRATLRATEIADRLLNLAPYLDTEHRAAALRRAAADGHSAEASRIIAEASTIHAALLATSTDHPSTPKAPDHRFESDMRQLPPEGIPGTESLAAISQEFSKIHRIGIPASAATSESK
ncbi:MAB_1171c family putative transporter [Streptomyces sp. NPDC059650]|uniref:MAB_1171c family putative transporter n=1 Tax=Streptomyces sp. NPDC059650 TaxID=3346896 RepID=UPI0036B5A753